MLSAIRRYFQSSADRGTLVDLTLNFLERPCEHPARSHREFLASHHFGREVQTKLQALLLPEVANMTTAWAKDLCLKGRYPVTTDCFLMTPVQTYLSKSGRDVTLVHGRSLYDPSYHVLVAYPEPQDLELLNKANCLAVRHGPGFFFPGSVGVMEFRERDRALEADYIQASVPISRAIMMEYLPEEFRRCYSSWSVCLLRSLQDYAELIGATTIKIPLNKIIRSTKLDKIFSNYRNNEEGQLEISLSPTAQPVRQLAVVCEEV